MAGVTADGYDHETYSEILARVKARIRGNTDERLLLTPATPEGQIVEILVDEISSVGDAAQASYHQHDPRKATGEAMVGLGLLTGTIRRAATRGTVPTLVTLAAGKTFAAGTMIAHVDGDAENRWYNEAEVTSTAAGSYAATFRSEATGSDTVAPIGTLTVIAEPLTGWTAIDNPASAATPGRNQETIEELRIRREDELASAGSATLASIRAAVSELSDVVDTHAEENLTLATVGDLDPKSFMIVVWDNAGAQSDDSIAQVIYDTRAAGTLSSGPDSGTASDPDLGTTSAEKFFRATATAITVSVDIVSSTGVLAADVRKTILESFTFHDGTDAANPTNSWTGIGEDVIHAKLQAAPFQLPGVDNLGSFTLNGGTSDVSIDNRHVASLPIANITVTGDVT